jgi:hypothetical protein
MKRSKEEAEVIVRLDFMDQQAHICVNQWPAMAERLTRKFGKPIEAGKFVARWIVPLKAVSFRTLTRINSVKSGTAPVRGFRKQVVEVGVAAQHAMS